MPSAGTMKKPSGYFPPIAILPPHHAASATTFHPANIETENLSRRENMPVIAQKPGQVPALHKNGQAGGTGATEPAHMNRKGCHLPAGFPKPVQPQPPTAPRLNGINRSPRHDRPRSSAPVPVSGGSACHSSGFARTPGFSGKTNRPSI